MLGFVSFSSWALLALLARWCARNMRQGGLKDLSARESSRHLLAALLSMVSGQGAELDLTIDLDLDWAIQWPRPMEPKLPARLMVDAFGKVSLGDWLRSFCDDPAVCPGHWRFSADFVQMSVNLGGEPSLMELFLACGVHAGADMLYRQLLWHIGRALEKTVHLALKSKANHIVVRVPGMEGALQASASSCDVELLRYIRSARQAAKDELYFSLCTDKSAVAGLGGGVQNVIFGLRPNVAIVGVPQVP